MLKTQLHEDQKTVSVRINRTRPMKTEASLEFAMLCQGGRRIGALYMKTVLGPLRGGSGQESISDLHFWRMILLWLVQEN
jgi:hypothetical protein